MKLAPCAACGKDPVPHVATYITVALDETLKPLFAPGPITRFLSRIFFMFESRLTPLIFRLMRRVGLATFVQEPDDHTMLLAMMLWEEAKHRGIEVVEVRLFGLARNIFLARFPNGKRIAYEGIPLPLSGIDQAWWTDNKAEMKKRFRKAGFPIARGGAALTISGAERIYKTLVPPVIVKPHSGSASRHTHLHIASEEALKDAFYSAKQLAPLAIIEEELVGEVYRATVVNGVLAATLRRDQPHVRGDGVHTVRELINTANEHPARGGPYFSKMQLNEEALVELSWQGLTPESVPESGKRVQLNQKINWSVGGTTADVSDIVHPDTVALFESATALLKTPVVGYDFIIGDITRSWKEQLRCGFIEANSMPFFDNHHLPFEGKPRNVAGKIWDMVEPKPKG